MSYISDTLRACEYLLLKAERNAVHGGGQSAAMAKRVTPRRCAERETFAKMKRRRAAVAHLLETTRKTQREIAAEVGVSNQLVSSIAVRLRKGGKA